MPDPHVNPATSLPAGSATVVATGTVPDLPPRWPAAVRTELVRRHRLILGDSRLTLPAYKASHPAETFDLLFIDGGHDDDIPALDLQHCLELAHTDSLIVLDDTMMYPVARAWQVALVSERIEQLGSSTYTEYGGRAMAWGRLKRD